MQFSLIRRLDYDEAEVSAGSFACDSQRLCVGTFSGWAVFDLDSLTLQFSQSEFLPEGCNISGIQFCDSTILLLGNHKTQAFDHPRDWDSRVYEVRFARETEELWRLPPGNWQMVRNACGPWMHCYDVSEGTGILGRNVDGSQWQTKYIRATKVVRCGEDLICLGERTYNIFKLDGTMTHDGPLPMADECRWTSIGCRTKKFMVLGGFKRENGGYVITRISTSDGKPLEPRIEVALHSVFEPRVIEHALSDECCGNDLSEVSKILPLQKETFLVGLGGHGEGLGACQGASALAIVDLLDGSWRTQVVDESEGISGLALLPDARIVADFCGDVRIYSYR